MSTKTRFEEEAKGNSEMAYLLYTFFGDWYPLHVDLRDALAGHILRLRLPRGEGDCHVKRAGMLVGKFYFNP